MSEKFTAIVADAKKQINEITIDDVAQQLQPGMQWHLVDVREAHEYAEGHLPEAIHIGKGVLERDLEKIIPDPEAVIVLYCGGGSRSALAALNAQKMGYSKVYSMAGGFRGWKTKGYSVVK